jgi:hypothetical protein
MPLCGFCCFATSLVHKRWFPGCTKGAQTRLLCGDGGSLGTRCLCAARHPLPCICCRCCCASCDAGCWAVACNLMAGLLHVTIPWQGCYMLQSRGRAVTCCNVTHLHVSANSVMAGLGWVCVVLLLVMRAFCKPFAVYVTQQLSVRIRFSYTECLSGQQCYLLAGSAALSSGSICGSSTY